MQSEESRKRGERDARQSREGSGSDLGRVTNETILDNEQKNSRYRFCLDVFGIAENDGSTSPG